MHHNLVYDVLCDFVIKGLWNDMSEKEEICRKRESSASLLGYHSASSSLKSEFGKTEQNLADSICQAAAERGKEACHSAEGMLGL